MAIIEKRRDSGEGDVGGLREYRATERFNVLLQDIAGEGIDAYTGEPDDIEDPITPVRARYPIGTPHTRSGFEALTVSDYQITERNKARQDLYIITVVYEGPDEWVWADPRLDSWMVEVETSLQPIEAVRDLRGQLIGGYAYRFPTQDAQGRLERATHHCQTVDGYKDLVQVQYREIIAETGQVNRDAVVTPESRTRLVPLTVMRLTRTLDHFDLLRQYGAAREYIGMVNRYEFIGGPIAAVLAGPLRVTRRYAQADPATGQPAGFRFDVELNFLETLQGLWTPETIYDRFVYDGYSGEVYPLSGAQGNELGRTPVSHSFEMYHARDLYRLLEIFT